MTSTMAEITPKQMDNRAKTGTTSAPSASPSTERMRRHRRRKLKRLRCVTVELFESEIDELIARGLLVEEERLTPSAVTAALHRFLDRNLKR